jgi:lipopolysaccharide transport system permease protein
MQEWQITWRDPGVGAVLEDIWRHRWLMNYVGDRALRKIYRRTVLGWLWLFINPLLPIAVRVLIFGALIGVSSDGIPYFLFLLCGTLVWDAFAVSLLWGTRALEMNRGLIDQVYAPRALLPIANMTPALLDMLIKSVVFALAAGYYLARDQRMYVRVGPGMWWAGAALLLVVAFAVALSYFTSIWGETGRDARFALGQVLSVWHLVTPVLFPLTAVPSEYRAWVLLNPLAVMVETFKWGLFGVGEFLLVPFLATALEILLIMFCGLLYFARAEARALDAR